MQYMQLMTHLSVALAVVGGAFVPNAQAAAPARVEAELRELDARWESAVAAKDLVKILSFDIGTLKSSTTDPKGNTVNYVGKYVVVWKKAADGQWKVAVDISNSDR